MIFAHHWKEIYFISLGIWDHRINVGNLKSAQPFEEAGLPLKELSVLVNRGHSAHFHISRRILKSIAHEQTIFLSRIIKKKKTLNKYVCTKNVSMFHIPGEAWAFRQTVLG